MSLALIYLSRGLGVGCGLESLNGFFNAYRAFSPGCPHDLIVIAKGWSGVFGQDQLQPLAQAHAARVVALPDDGFDWGAYMRLAPQLSQEWLCFLNTYSRPRATNWLELLMKAADSPGTGAVGATASWETLAPILPPPSVKAKYNIPLLYPFRLIYNTIRFVTNILAFPVFPNPHLRSNAFIVRRELFIDFVASQKIPRCKHDVALIESGRSGFSAYLSSHGLKAFVIGADGKVYNCKQWKDSGTFRVPGQPNLLVEDNQTEAYAMADSWGKRALEMRAWGQSFSEGDF